MAAVAVSQAPRRPSHRPVTARRSLLFDVGAAHDYFAAVGSTERPGFVSSLAVRAHRRFRQQQHAAGNPDAGQALMIEALASDVLSEMRKAVDAGDVLLHLTSSCCPTDACDKIDFKQCVVDELCELFAHREALPRQ